MKLKNKNDIVYLGKLLPTQGPSTFEFEIILLFPKIKLFFLIVCFNSYFVLSIAVFPHSPGVVYYHLLLR